MKPAMLESETSLKNSISLPSGDIISDSNACTKVRKQELRNASKTHTSLDQTSIDMRTSLQQCELQGLAFLLNYQYEEAKRLGHRKKQQKLKGILEIHSHLLLKPDFGNADHVGYIDFDIAYELYCGHQDFRDILLHPDYGLCVHIVNFLELNKQYIIVRTQTLDLPTFIVELNTMITKGRDPSSLANITRLDLDKNSLQCILNSMDSEWDRKRAKVIFVANQLRMEMEELGFHPKTLIESVQQVKTIIEETVRTKIAAHDCIMLRLCKREGNLKAQINECTLIIERKVGIWQDYRINEVSNKLNIVKEQLDDNARYISCLENPDEADKYVKQKVQQRIKRTGENLAEFHRLKRRELQKGKKMIKSATTPWNRSRPRNRRSRQAKLYISKGLFCTKKPPKAEDCDNENMHHQRSHCKNVQQFLSCDDSNRKFGFIKSMDDKAYIRQGHLVFSSIHSFCIYNYFNEDVLATGNL